MTKGRIIRLIINEEQVQATLYNNRAAEDFFSLLPLELSLNDYAGTEKISNLPRSLTVANTPAGHQPTAGEITYYAPWGNLAIFYKEFAYSKGLIALGKIEGSIAFLSAGNLIKIRIEPIA